ncbi:hypothetical protein O0L34_g15877 [Tuta absoluta]|nr:hypothetical protein O0L34_g15877 [Tuta absoluta]
MNEHYPNLNFTDLTNICRVCLSANNLRQMHLEEINWYQTIMSKMLVLSPKSCLNICLICGHLLKKFMRFYNYCHYTHDILSKNSGVEKFLRSNELHNYTESKIINNNSETIHDSDDRTDIVYLDDKAELDLQNDVTFDDDDVQNVSDKDDDTPLVMLSKSNGFAKENGKLKKKRKKIKNEVEKPDSTMKLKITKEGFSSRMVQETDEYVVLKLTKEQVLEEMRERSTCEKYQRALYKCTLCVQGFNFEDVLTAHMEKHTKENGSFECEMCHQFCPSAVSLRGHVKSHTTRYKCKICGVVRRGRQHLLEHHALTHTHDAQQYTCHHCDFTTDKRTVIQRHVRSHRASERHACHECGRLFHTVESLRVHTTRHDKSRSLRCGECGRGFLYPSLLARHRESVHQRTEYYCVECDVRFKSPDNLRLHFKKAKRHRDSSSYTYSCSQCSEKFVSGASLAVHSSTAHGHPKRYACELCRRLYSSKESLRAHVRRAHKTDSNAII